jgi:hypothetical protein
MWVFVCSVHCFWVFQQRVYVQPHRATLRYARSSSCHANGNKNNAVPLPNARAPCRM